jgi:hypothetical protein
MLCEQDGGLAMGVSTSAVLSHVFLQNTECRSWGSEVATLCCNRIMSLKIMWHVVAQGEFLSAETVEVTLEQGVSEPAVEQEQWKEETGTRHKAWRATSG